MVRAPKICCLSIITSAASREGGWSPATRESAEVIVAVNKQVHPKPHFLDP
jgi:hypothetical protein